MTKCHKIPTDCASRDTGFTIPPPPTPSRLTADMMVCLLMPRS